jgi:hypothetical protein
MSILSRCMAFAAGYRSKYSTPSSIFCASCSIRWWGLSSPGKFLPSSRRPLILRPRTVSTACWSVVREPGVFSFTWRHHCPHWLLALAALFDGQGEHIVAASHALRLLKRWDTDRGRRQTDRTRRQGDRLSGGKPRADSDGISSNLAPARRNPKLTRTSKHLPTTHPTRECAFCGTPNKIITKIETMKFVLLDRSRLVADLWQKCHRRRPKSKVGCQYMGT